MKRFLLLGLALLGLLSTPAPTSSATITTRGVAAARAYGFGGLTARDPFFSFVTFLTHADSFVDVKGHTMTANNGAAISTTTKKYGTGSISFDGIDDSVTAAASSDWTFGSSVFTIEGWVNFGTAAGDQALVANTASTVGNDSFLLLLHANTINFWTWNTALVTGATTIVAGQWYYVALSYDGTTYRLFLNGVLDGTSTFGQTLSGVNALTLGQTGVASTKLPMTGFLDEVRITKGVCRYTSNFTPPARPFPNR